MAEPTYILEINLISAQGLKPPSANLRRFQTYAITWVDPAFKLRTRIDRIGGENPTWNDKFFFRVSSDFLSNITSAVSIEIFSVGYLKDPLVGTVRFLFGNALSGDNKFGVPTCTALQIRRPSGRFQGVLNIGATLINASDFASSTGSSAIGFRDLMDEDRQKRRRRRKIVKGDEENYSGGGNSCQASSCADSDADSSCSSTSTTTSMRSLRSTVLRDWNWNGGRREMAGKRDRSDGGGAMIFCGLGFQKRERCPSDQNLQIGDDENSRSSFKKQYPRMNGHDQVS